MKLISKHRYIFTILTFCILFIILRFPSLVEPNWYGDEGIYQVIGKAINDGRILYQEIWDNKPPMLYLVYAVFNGSLFYAKLLSLIFGLLSVVVFYYLCETLFKNRKAILISCFIYTILFGTPYLEGNIANAENFMLLTSISAAFLVIKYQKNKNIKDLIFAGILLSISLSFKIVAVFDFLAFLTFLIIANGKITKNKGKDYLFFTLSFVSTLIISAVYFLANNAFYDFIHAVFIQNYSYVGEENVFFLPMGILFVKSLILLGLVFTVFKLKDKINTNSLFIYLWTAFGIYSALFSARPYTHYLLILLPAFCLLIADLIEHKKIKLIESAFIVIIILITFFHFDPYKKTISYYKNFVDFVFGQKSVDSYQSFFDNNTPRDYMLAEFIKSNLKDHEKVFLWSDSAQIYALSEKLPIGKYTVAYHIRIYDNADRTTEKILIQDMPLYIIQTAENPMIKNILSNYKLKFDINGAKIYEKQI